MLRHNTSFTTTYFAAAACLLLTGVVLIVGESLARPTLQFGTCYLKADIARTEEQQAKGLAGRDSIPSTYAMIFPFNDQQPSFWMKGMRTPIDILWVDKTNKVVKIQAQVPADDGATYYNPGQPINWVVETAPGRAASCNVLVGTEIKGLRR